MISSDSSNLNSLSDDSSLLERLAGAPLSGRRPGLEADDLSSPACGSSAGRSSPASPPRGVEMSKLLAFSPPRASEVAVPPLAAPSGEKLIPDCATEPAADLSLRLAAGEDLAGVTVAARTPAPSAGSALIGGTEEATICSILLRAVLANCAGAPGLLWSSSVSP